MMHSEAQSRLFEARLLSTLCPGELLRFVFQRVSKTRMSFSLDGAGDDALGLQERISTILTTSRSLGFSFRDEPGFDPNITAPPDTGFKFVEIVPDGHDLRHLPHLPIGFAGDTTTPEAQESAVLYVPNFPALAGLHLAEHPVSLVLNTPAILGLEMEVTRLRLPESSAAPVALALQQEISLRREITGTELPASPLASFLALWWSRRAGWGLRCRVAVDENYPLPSGTLHVVGREVFGVECTIAENEVTPAFPSHDRPCFVQAYPDGWPLPALLPGRGNHAFLSAERLHNLGLPELSRDGFPIGVADSQEVCLPDYARDRHVYIIGATGTGKTTLLSRLIRNDLQRNESLILLDPHGDLYQEILKAIPTDRQRDLVTIDPNSGQDVIPFNLLDFPRDEFTKRRAELLVGELIRFFRESWDVPEAFGPMFEVYFRNALRLLIHQDAEPVTLLDFERVFTDRKFRRSLLEACTEQSVRSFWSEMAERAGGDISLENITPYITSKMTLLTQSSFLSEMIGQPRDDLRLEDRINANGIILANLSKGLLGAHESRFLGVLLTMQIFAAGLKRSNLAPCDRSPVNVYIDEFQNFISDNVASMLSEARKFGLRMNLANQTLCQLGAGGGRQNLLETVLGNVGNMIVFRLGVPDAERLRPFLSPFVPEQIQDLPNFHALGRFLDQEGPVGPLILRTYPDSQLDPDSADPKPATRKYRVRRSGTRKTKAARP